MNSSTLIDRLPSSRNELLSDIKHFLQEQLDSLYTYSTSTFRPDGFFGGYPTGPMETPDLAHTLALFRQAGGTHVAGKEIKDLLVDLLSKVDGPRTNTFYSYRVAETLLSFGPFDGNELLSSFSEEQKANLAEACDSTSIFNPETGKLDGYPANYWGVLGRCESGRKRLGLEHNADLLDLCLRKCVESYRKSPEGFHNDTPETTGRYDIYTADLILFLMPLWEAIGAEESRRIFQRQWELVEAGIQDNGASFVWGRSTGALSICLTMEMATLALEENLGHEPARCLGLVAYSFKSLQGWFDRGLVTAHRDRMTFDYRGPHRLLQMSVDILGKVAMCLRHLRQVADADKVCKQSSVLFPVIDRHIALGPNNAGVWLYRDEHQAFQLPIIPYPWCADYVPWPKSPGRYEDPVQSVILPGLPRVALKDGRVAAPYGPASEVEHSPGCLKLTYNNLTTTDPDAHQVAIRLALEFRPDGHGLNVSMEMTELESGLLAGRPVSVALCEASCELSVVVRGRPAWQGRTIDVAGSPPFRSFWGSLGRLHEWVLHEAEATEAWCVKVECLSEAQPGGPARRPIFETPKSS